MLKDEAVAGGDVDYLERILQRYDLAGLLEHGVDGHIQIALVAHINRPLRILSAPLEGVAGGAGKVHIAYGMAGLFDQLWVKVCGVEIPLCSVAVFNAVFAHMAPAVPDKVKRIGIILGAEFDGSETPEQIGRKAADAYIAFRDGLGMPPVTEAGIYVEDIDALAELVVHEPFAQLTPVPVNHDSAVRMLKEMLSL